MRAISLEWWLLDDKVCADDCDLLRPYSYLLQKKTSTAHFRVWEICANNVGLL